MEGLAGASGSCPQSRRRRVRRRPKEKQGRPSLAPCLWLVAGRSATLRPPSPQAIIRQGVGMGEPPPNGLGNYPTLARLWTSVPAACGSASAGRCKTPPAGRRRNKLTKPQALPARRPAKGPQSAPLKSLCTTKLTHAHPGSRVPTASRANNISRGRKVMAEETDFRVVRGSVGWHRRWRPRIGPARCSRSPNMISAPSPAGPRPSTTSFSPNIYLEDVHVLSAARQLRLYKRAGRSSGPEDLPEGAIHATFNTGSFLGARGATLTVTLDKPFPAEVQLHVKGVIRSDVIFTPGSVQFGDVEQGQPAVKERRPGLRRPRRLEGGGREEQQPGRFRATDGNRPGGRAGLVSIGRPPRPTGRPRLPPRPTRA